SRKLTAIVAIGLMLTFASIGSAQLPAAVKLECESLVTPLGMDTKEPLLSWKMEDSRAGARQTGYQIMVASSADILARGKADVWDSGRVQSSESRGIRYGGPAMAPSTRYYWRVVIWDQDGKPSEPSESSWWETGLLEQKNWKAQWIGYEEPELRRIRESGAVWITNPETEAPEKSEKTNHDFRFQFQLTKPVKRGVLYVAGQDTAGAWVNGKQVLQSQPLPPWKQMPWKTYTAKDVSGVLHSGQNLLAIEIVRYETTRRRGTASISQTPMSEVLYVEDVDGSVELFKSGTTGWRATLNSGGNWQT